jgi:hypothetical protein
MTGGRFERQLRWYPPEWRARYGAELVALMEDHHGASGALPTRTRLGLVRAGVAERVRRSILAGGDAPAERVRSGCLLVLCGWSIFVVAGSGFAKISEHWDAAIRNADRLVPTDAYDTVQTAAAVGSVIVAVAALGAFPPFVRLLRAGGWSRVRRPVTLAAAACAAAIAATAGAVIWSHRPAHPPLGPVPVAGVGWALLVIAAIGTTTVSVVRVAGRLRLPRAVLRLEGLLAVSLSVVMLAVLGGTVAWWGAIATDAPRFLSTGGAGLFETPGTPSMGAAGGLMALGLALGLWGDVRVLRQLRATGRTPSAPPART